MKRKKIEKRMMAAVLGIGMLITEPAGFMAVPYTVGAKTQPTMELESDEQEQQNTVTKSEESIQQAKCVFEENTGCLTFYGPGVITGNPEDASNEAGMKYMDIATWTAGIDLERIRSIVIEDGVTEIGEGVFTYLRNVENVTIASSVKSIGAGAFGGCRNLKEIVIGNDGRDGITEIGDYAFADCDALEKVTLGKGVTKLGDRFLGEVPVLKKIVVEKGNENFIVKDGMLYSADGKMLYLCPKKGKSAVSVAKGTRTVKQLAFAHASITKVTIPASVKVLEAGAFYSCKNLNKVTFAKGSECLRTEEYYHYFGDEVEESYSAFGECRRLKSISFGNKLETLSENTFEGCIKLESIHLGKNFRGFIRNEDKKVLVTALNQRELTCLQKITVSKKNKKYSDLRGVLYSKSGKRLCMYPGGKKETVFRVADSVEVIGDSAFWDNKELKRVILGKKVKEVEYFAFGDCSKLAAVEMGDVLKKIGESAFWGDKSLSEVKWSKKLRYIGDYAFFGCSQLKSIALGNCSDAVVKRGAFAGCKNVTTVVWPKGFQKIEAAAFRGCKKISRAVIAGKKLAVSDYAFYNCSGLKRVTIKSGVVRLGQQAFYGCTKLHSVFVPESVTTIGKKALGYKWSLSLFDDARMKSFQIKGKKGSRAENYAKENKIPFAPN